MVVCYDSGEYFDNTPETLRLVNVFTCTCCGDPTYELLLIISLDTILPVSPKLQIVVTRARQHLGTLSASIHRVFAFEFTFCCGHPTYGLLLFVIWSG